MQLIILLAVLMLGGDAIPVLKEMGGEEIKPTLEEAEKIGEVITAALAFKDELLKGQNISSQNVESEHKNSEGEKTKPNACGLSPIEGIAPTEILSGLSAYFAV